MQAKSPKRPIKSRFSISKASNSSSQQESMGIQNENRKDTLKLRPKLKENTQNVNTTTDIKPKKSRFTIQKTSTKVILPINEITDDLNIIEELTEVDHELLDFHTMNYEIKSESSDICNSNIVNRDEAKSDRKCNISNSVMPMAGKMLLSTISEIIDKILKGEREQSITVLSDLMILDQFLSLFVNLTNKQFIDEQISKICNSLKEYILNEKVYISFMEMVYINDSSNLDISNFDRVLQISNIFIVHYKCFELVTTICLCFQSSKYPVRDKSLEFMINYLRSSNSNDFKKIMNLFGKRLSLIPSFGINEMLMLFSFVFQQKTKFSSWISTKLMNCIAYSICVCHKAPHYLTFKKDLIKTEKVITDYNNIYMFYFRKSVIDNFPPMDCYRTTIFFDELNQLFTYQTKIEESLWNRVISHLQSHHPLVVIHTIDFINKTFKSGLSAGFDYKNVFTFLKNNIANHWNDDVREKSACHLSELVKAGVYASESTSPIALKNWKRIASMCNTTIEVPFRNEIPVPDIMTDRQLLIETIASIRDSNYEEKLHISHEILTKNNFNSELVRVVHSIVPRMISSKNTRVFAHEVASLTFFKGSSILRNTADLLVGFLFDGSDSEKHEARLCLNQMSSTVEEYIMKMIVSRVRRSIVGNIDDVAIYLADVIHDNRGIVNPADYLLILQHCDSTNNSIASALRVIESHVTHD